MAWQKLPIYFLWSTILCSTYILTNYRQLLLYISYDKNNLYMFVTSKCFLVPLHSQHKILYTRQELHKLTTAYCSGSRSSGVQSWQASYNFICQCYQNCLGSLYYLSSVFLTLYSTEEQVIWSLLPPCIARNILVNFNSTN